MKTKKNWVDSVVESMPEGYEWVSESLITAMNSASLTELQRHGVALVASILSNNGELAFEICMNSPLFGTPERELAKKCAVIMEMARINISGRIINDHFTLEQLMENDKTAMVFVVSAKITRSITQVDLNDFDILDSNIINDIRAICAVVSIMNKIIV